MSDAHPVLLLWYHMLCLSHRECSLKIMCTDSSNKFTSNLLSYSIYSKSRREACYFSELIPETIKLRKTSQPRQPLSGGAGNEVTRGIFYSRRSGHVTCGDSTLAF